MITITPLLAKIRKIRKKAIKTNNNQVIAKQETRTKSATSAAKSAKSTWQVRVLGLVFACHVLGGRGVQEQVDAFDGAAERLDASDQLIASQTERLLQLRVAWGEET